MRRGEVDFQWRGEGRRWGGGGGSRQREREVDWFLEAFSVAGVCIADRGQRRWAAVTVTEMGFVYVSVARDPFHT